MHLNLKHGVHSSSPLDRMNLSSSFHFVSFAKPESPPATASFRNFGISEVKGLSSGTNSSFAFGSIDFIFLPNVKTEPRPCLAQFVREHEM